MVITIRANWEPVVGCVEGQCGGCSSGVRRNMYPFASHPWVAHNSRPHNAQAVGFKGGCGCHQDVSSRLRHDSPSGDPRLWQWPPDQMLVQARHFQKLMGHQTPGPAAMQLLAKECFCQETEQGRSAAEVQGLQRTRLGRLGADDCIGGGKAGAHSAGCDPSQKVGTNCQPGRRSDWLTWSSNLNQPT